MIGGLLAQTITQEENPPPQLSFNLEVGPSLMNSASQWMDIFQRNGLSGAVGGGFLGGGGERWPNSSMHFDLVFDGRYKFYPGKVAGGKLMFTNNGVTRGYMGDFGRPYVRFRNIGLAGYYGWTSDNVSSISMHLGPSLMLCRYKYDGMWRGSSSSASVVKPGVIAGFRISPKQIGKKLNWGFLLEGNFMTPIRTRPFAQTNPGDNPRGRIIGADSVRASSFSVRVFVGLNVDKK